MGSSPLTTLVQRRLVLGLAAQSAFAFTPSILWASAGRAGGWDFGRSMLNWETMEIVTGDTLVVAARLNGHSIRGILDSGSGASIINLPLATILGLDKGEARTVSGLGGKTGVNLIRNVDVGLSGDVRTLPFAVVGDLGAISAALGRPVDLLIGADMFAERCVAIDFGQRRFALAPSGSFSGGPGWTSVALTRGSKQELLVSAAIAGGAPVPLMIDLGSSAALMLSAAYLNENTLLDGRTTSTAALGGVEGVRAVTLFTLDHLQLGGIDIAAIPSLGTGSWLPTSSVGNIGLPLIAQFDVVFDVTLGRLWLRPLPASRRLPMLKDRSGLGLATTADGLTAVHVAPGSPAAQNGWRPGDRIMEVNGEPVGPEYTHGSLWQWRYGRAGDVVKLTLATGEQRLIRLADY